MQLTTLAVQFDGNGDLHFQDILTYMRDFSAKERAIFSEVVVLLILILANPAINATRLIIELVNRFANIEHRMTVFVTFSEMDM